MRRRLPGLLGRVGGNVCGHCLPLSARISTSPSAEADAVSQSIPVPQGKGKGGDCLETCWAAGRPCPYPSWRRRCGRLLCIRRPGRFGRAGGKRSPDKTVPRRSGGKTNCKAFERGFSSARLRMNIFLELFSFMITILQRDQEFCRCHHGEGVSWPNTDPKRNQTVGRHPSRQSSRAVSYTHLTLPTIYSV